MPNYDTVGWTESTPVTAARLGQMDEGIRDRFNGYTEPRDDRGDVSGTVTLDFTVSNWWRINPTGSVTLAVDTTGFPSGHGAGGTLLIANSSHAITFPAGSQFDLGLTPDIEGKTYLSLVVEPDGTLVWSTALVDVSV